MPSSDLAGKWTYRSFRNDPTPVDGDPNKALGLFFAEAEFSFEAVSDTTFKGVIDWGSGGLDLSGTIKPGASEIFSRLIITFSSLKTTETGSS